MIMDIKTEAASLVSKMTIDEKVKLCTGKDFWNFNGVERLGLPAIMVTDGPHGLRKQVAASDHLGLSASVPATCFPTAAATACSFDEDLMFKMGQALGEECRKEQVSVLLGPGVNIKRSPICGRNFEYVSEDPLVTGRIAAALIKGIQSQGIGTSIKHFAANSQETKRMTSDSVVDERALREIYLRGFEIAITEAKPWTVMNAYNRLNGIYCGENSWLLTEVLRKEWGYEGAVITDWGALVHPIESFAAGLNVEMPGIGNGYELLLKEAVEQNSFPAAKLDEIAAYVVGTILKAREGQSGTYTCDMDAHLALAATVVEESAVLLKNDGILPGNSGRRSPSSGLLPNSPGTRARGAARSTPCRSTAPMTRLSRRAVRLNTPRGIPRRTPRSTRN
jgi:beta-glucosidase